MKISLYKMHFPVTTLGPGSRIGIWFQGCSIRCPGCISQDTWEFSGAKSADLEAIFPLLRSWMADADGFTISGGEPFDQPKALANLLDWISENGGDRDVLVFSGYDFMELKQKHDSVLSKIDALVSGPFLRQVAHSQELRGSNNQVLHRLSDRGRKRFCNESERAEKKRTLDVSTDDEGGLWFAGIPISDEWEQVANSLHSAGVDAKFSHQPQKP